jgi:hypothetical protein
VYYDRVVNQQGSLQAEEYIVNERVLPDQPFVKCISLHVQFLIPLIPEQPRHTGFLVPISNKRCLYYFAAWTQLYLLVLNMVGGHTGVFFPIRIQK